MKKALLFFAFLATTSVLVAQATTGYHRVNQVLARSNSGTYAVVQPYSTISVTSTATGLAATIYSDPLLTAPISPSVITADQSGNYDYYIALGYCVTETIAYPGSGGVTIPNVCVISGSTTGQINNGTTGQLAYYASSGNVLSGETFATLAQGGTGATTASGAWTNIVAGVGTQSANTVWAGPTTGSAALPTFRTLVSADIPNNAANTAGNAATATIATTASTATALAGSPTQCTGGQFATGITTTGNANCSSSSVGITQLSGDGAAGPGSGSQSFTLATVNSGPGTCGDSTHVCQVVTNGKGLVTAQTSISIASGFTSGNNANGYWVTDPTGTTTERGSITVTNGGATLATGTITFPLTFPTALDSLVVSGGGYANGSSQDSETFYSAAQSTSGATAIMRCSVNIGGSGCASISNTVTIYWIAVGR